MRVLMIVFFSALSTSTAFANSLSCFLQINNSRAIQSHPQTNLNERTPIALSSEVQAYITEKQNQGYMIEAFVPGVDARFYSEGSLKDASDRLKAAFWGRDLLLEIECRLSQ